MTSYLPPSDENFYGFWKILSQEYHHAKFGCICTTNKGEIEGGHNVPPQPILFQKTQAWIGLKNFHFKTAWKLFPKIFIRSVKMHHVELNSATSKWSK